MRQTMGLHFLPVWQVIDGMNTVPYRPVALARAAVLVLALSMVSSTPREASGSELINLTARSRAESAPGSSQWVVKSQTLGWDPGRTAVVICDMWNQHWCSGATRRVAEMAPRMNEFVKAARAKGMMIIHCPSDTMKHYEGTPQRKLAQAAPSATTRVPLQRWCNLDRAHEAPLPIDDSDGGCDESPQCKQGGPWNRQIDTIEIKEGDAITDSAEAYFLMRQRGITNVMVMGVHLNMCVLGRPFSIRQMVQQGQNVLLVRDLTDTMYNSRKSPFVPHTQGTQLMIEHVEKYWCASIDSTALLGGKPFQFAERRSPKIGFIIGENEYHTWETLPAFAGRELIWRGIEPVHIQATSNPTDLAFTNYQAIAEVDALLISVRRRTPPAGMMKLIKAHVEAGKPVLGIRTATHAFAAKPPSDEYAAWDTLDRDVFGVHYENHYGNDFKPTVQFQEGTGSQPWMTGVDRSGFVSKHSLYRSRDLSAQAIVLATGVAQGKTEVEPVAWVITNGTRRAFYTSLGGPEDFKEPSFRRLLLNAMLWSVDWPIPLEPRSASVADAALKKN